ncbi:MAG: type II toxin-antitoxin system PemK/MazF family toxin [bacterium]|jgi:mRNA interferase MazF
MKRFAANKGEVFFADLDPVIGREQAGRRPAVIISTVHLSVARGLVVAIPGTKFKEAHESYSYAVNVPRGVAGLPLNTTFLVYQTRVLDVSRLSFPKIGDLPDQYMRSIERCLLRLYEINPFADYDVFA